MGKYTIRMILSLVLLAFLQVVLFNHLLLFGYFLPIIYLYPLIRMPYDYEPWVLTLTAAVAGFCIDMMMNTPGLNMASSTLAIYIRPALLKAFVDQDDLENSDEVNPMISSRIMSGASYFMYVLTIVLIHIATLFLLEAFSFRLFVHTLPFIGGSVCITIVLYFIFDALLVRRSRR